jgi:hypothetical protein
MSAADTTIRLAESDTLAVDSRPDWHSRREQGWYVKEHHHAADFAFLVCDDQSAGATFAYDLKQAVPAGDYRILVRHVRMRRGGENRIRLELGTGDADAFTVVGSTEMAWTSDDKPRDYRWADTRITASGAADRLRVTALKVERTGIGDLPEYPLNTILLDTVILTARTDYTITHASRSSKLVLPGLVQTVSRDSKPLPARNHVWSAPDPEDLARVRQIGAATAPEKAARPTGNLIADGSFEGGTQPNWFVIKDGTTGYELDRSFLDHENPGHGGTSLRLRGATGFYRSARSAVTLSAAPVVAPAGAYTCTFLARSDAPKLDVQVRVASFLREQARFKTGPVFASLRPATGAEWQPYRFSFTLAQQQYLQLVVTATGFDGTPDKRGLSSTSLWLDAVCIRSDGDTFAPASPVEIGVFTDCQRLFHPGTLDFNLRVAAHDQRAVADLTYTILDLAWAPVTSGNVRVELDKFGSGETALSIPFTRRGAYLIRLAADGVARSEVVLDLAVVDDPAANKAPPNLGIYTAYNPDAMDYFERSGAGYYFSLCDGSMFRPYRTLVLPAALKGKQPADSAETIAWLQQAEMRTYDDLVRRIQTHGMEVIPEFLSGQMPKWAKGDPAAFGAHVRRVVAHYKRLGIRRWMTGDEVRRPYLPYHRAAAQAIKAEQPAAEVMVSTAPGVIDYFSEEMGDNALSAATGGSNWNVSKWIYQEQAETQDRMGVPYWNIGVGWGSRPAYMYDPHAIRMNQQRGRFNLVTNVLYCQAIAAPAILTTYTNRFTNGRAFGTNDMYTGTYVPHGTYFTVAAGFVRGATRGGEVPLETASDLDAFYLQRNGRTVVVVCQSQAFWGAPRGESAFDLQIDADPAQLGFYDIDLSEVPRPSAAGGRFSWQLPVYGALLLEDRGMGKDALLAAVAGMRATKRHGARHLVICRADGGLDLGLWLNNGLDRHLAGTVAVSRRLALAPSAPRQRQLELGPGESALLRFQLPEKLGTSRPIGNLIVGHTFSDNASFAHGATAHVWAACAKRRAPRSAATGPAAWRADELVGYVYATSRHGGGYGVEQVRKGGRLFVRADAHHLTTRLFARWQPDGVTIGLDIDAATAARMRRVALMLDPGLVATLRGTSAAITPRVFRIDLADGSADTPSVTVARQAHDDGIWLDVRIPAAALGVTPAATMTMGFNVVLDGALPDDQGQLQLVYSGRPNYQTTDPAGWAQLVLLPE